MSNSIRLSPKYGVNPTMPLCFFCGQPTGEIALLGMLKNDVEAPKYMLLNYEPCDKCKEAMKQGVTCICVTEHPSDNRPPIQGNLYPTGEWAVMREESVRRLLPEEDAKRTIKKARSCWGKSSSIRSCQSRKKHEIFDRPYDGHIFYCLLLWKQVILDYSFCIYLFQHLLFTVFRNN